MKNSLLALCVITLVSLVGWTSYGQQQNSSRITWEYLVTSHGSPSSKGLDLNRLGSEGWELTAVTTTEEVISDRHYPVTTYYFKRKK